MRQSQKIRLKRPSSHVRRSDKYNVINIKGFRKSQDMVAFRNQYHKILWYLHKKTPKNPKNLVFLVQSFSCPDLWFLKCHIQYLVCSLSSPLPVHRKGFYLNYIIIHHFM